MRVLAIETSCDETSIAVVSNTGDRFCVETNILSSQAELHAQYGGVVPEVAAREHASYIMPMLTQAGVPHTGEGIDGIVVTAGPGLVPALRIGVELAKTLAWMWKKPLVAVNHLEGHIYSTWIKTDTIPTLPAICLLVSGGHTELIQMRDHGQYELLGMTRDDAAGEAFDKVAKLLGMSYPGGPNITKAAKEADPEAIAFPRPMIDSRDLDFSFSGLKTAVRVYLEKYPDVQREEVAASFQQAVVEVLVTKTMKAVMETEPASVILSGGVSANPELRAQLAHAVSAYNPSMKVHAPDLSLTGDNAAMIAVAGLKKLERGETVDPLTLEADPNMRLASYD